MRKIAIVGANGLPAKYGGFETLTKYLVKYLSNENEFIVYCSRSNRENPKPKYKNVKLVYSPFNANGIESLLFDFSTIMHAFFNGATDIILLGASGAFALPFNIFFKKNIIYNIGGIEWKKVVGSKFTTSIERKFKKLLERICARFSNHIIIDNMFFYNYVLDNYNKNPTLAEYGGDHNFKKNINNDLLKKFPFLKEEYDFSMARAKEDMKIHLVIEAYKQLTDRNIIIVSNWNSSEYGRNLYSKNYNKFSNIYLVNAIYDLTILNSIRSNASLYIHSHSLCGTAPSLVEAMYLGLPIISIDVPQNRLTTENGAFYFNNSDSLTKLLSAMVEKKLKENSVKMLQIAKNRYSWKKIVLSYENCFS